MELHRCDQYGNPSSSADATFTFSSRMPMCLGLNGNSVVTAHVWDAPLNKPGPFAKLKDLKYGDQIRIHAFGQVYIYEIRESSLIAPNNTAAIFQHEEKAWLTLITCEDYKETANTYSYRRMVRAVLVSVVADR